MTRMIRQRHKFNAVRTERNGFTFDSQKEAAYYDELVLMQKAGDVVGFFRQVPIHLPGGITYRMDFLVFYANGECEGVEVKGYQTKQWKLKQKLVEHHYPWFNLRVI